MQVTIKIKNLNEVKARLASAPVKTASELNSAINKSALTIVGNAKRELGGSNGGWDTGRMSNSISSMFGFLRAEVGPHVGYAIYVHEGTRPHWAPISALAPWARRHGIEPFVVQRAIARKGTKANPFLQRAVTGAEKDIFKIFEKAVENILKL